MATPPVTTGFVAQHDARSLAASDGDAISTWPDESGNGNDLTTTNPDGSTDYDPPTYRANKTLNGSPALDFFSNGPTSNGSFDGDFLRWPNGVISKRSGTTLVYTRTDQAQEDFQTAVVGSPDGAFSDWRLHFDASVATPFTQVKKGSTELNWDNDVETFSAYAIRGDGDELTGWEDGVKKATGTDTEAADTLRCGVGALLNGDTTGRLWAPGRSSLQGPIALVLHYDRALTDMEIQDVMNWMVSEMEGSGAVSGTLALTDQGETIVGQGGTIAGGTLSLTDGLETFAAQGGALVSGTATIIDEQENVQVLGDVRVGGALEVVDEGETVASTAEALVSGSLAVTEGGEIFNFTSSQVIGGSLSVTDDSEAVSGQGETLIGGTVTLTDGRAAVVVFGSTLVTGSGEVIDADEIISAGGTVSISGTLSVVDGQEDVSFFSVEPPRLATLDVVLRDALQIDVTLSDTITLDVTIQD